MGPLRLVWDNPDALREPDEPESCMVYDGYFDETLIDGVVVPKFVVRIPNPGGLKLLSGERTAMLVEEIGPWGYNDIAIGRLVGIPSELGDEEIEVEFQSLPQDDEERLRTLADTVRVGEVDGWDTLSPEDRAAAEQYDPLFYNAESNDPLEVLAGTMSYIAWGRTSRAPSLRPLVRGGLKVLPEHEGFDLSITRLSTPRTSYRLRLVAGWTQRAKGVQTFPVGGGSGTWTVDTYSFDDLKNSFPAVGTEVGSGTGWTLAEAEVRDVADLLPDEFDANPLLYANGDANVTDCKIVLRAKRLGLHMRLGYDYSQQREEYLDIDVTPANQAVIGDDRKEAPEVIQLGALNLDLVTPEWSYEDPDTLDQRHYDVDDEVQANGRVWRCVEAHDATERFLIGIYTDPYDYGSYTPLWTEIAKKSAMRDQRSGRFWDTPRGERARNHGLRRLRRRVWEESHCLEATVTCSWAYAQTVSHLDDLQVTHPVHGTLRGPVVSRRLVVADGARTGELRFLIPIGSGVEIEPEGEHETDGMTYDLIAPTPNSPVNVAALPSVAPTVTVVNEQTAQRTAALFEGDPVAVISAMPTRVQIQVPRLREEDLIVRRCRMVVDPIAIPQGIEL